MHTLAAMILLIGGAIRHIMVKDHSTMYNILQKLIDKSCRPVYEGRWDIQCREGWRWASNLSTQDIPLSTQVIQEYQRVHGVTNVAIGHPFNEEEMRPKSDPGGYQVGAYVRDVDHIVESLWEMFDTPVENWKTVSV